MTGVIRFSEILPFIVLCGVAIDYVTSLLTCGAQSL